jgi:carbonic anhydrase
MMCKHMKTHLMTIATLGTLVILLTNPVEASDPHWDHTTVDQEPGQGKDGTYWATLEFEGNQVTPNSAQFKYPYAECAIGSHQSPIAINLASQTIETNPKAEPERRADSLVVQYTPSISSTGGRMSF